MEINHGFYEDVPECPVCEIGMQRVIKPVRAIFKGTGWGRD
jgi:predicted nucleic acid-binding Zn ribbon protein